MDFCDFDWDIRKRQFDPGGWSKIVYQCLPLDYLFGGERAYYRRLIAHAPNLELGIDCRALDKIIPRHLAKIQELLGFKRVSVHMPFYDLHPAALDARIAAVSLRRLRQAADAALKLGARQAVFHLGFDPRLNRNIPQFIDLYCQRTLPVYQQLQIAGCVPVIENVFEPTPEVLLMARKRLQETSGALVGICLDVGHATAFNSTSLQCWWQACAPFLREMHLHDNLGDDDLHQAIGSGVVDFSLLGGELAKPHIPMPQFTLELRDEESYWQSLRALQQLWGPAPHGGCHAE
jgi:sugar phosphate isomerase/epimerase